MQLEKPSADAERSTGTVFPILIAISFSHLLNDTMQSLIPAIYPIVKESFHLTFTQVGLITLTFQMTASLLQPVVGFYTDRNPQPFSLAVGMTLTLTGLVCLAFASSFPWLLLSVGFVGLGSAIFHPESSRVAYMASGGRHGFAQSLFQVGGNAGSSFGPLCAALIVAGPGQRNVLWFTLAHTFHVSVASAQVHLFIFLLAVAAGTFLGGPMGDRFGRKYVIWISILGVAPFTVLLPYANLLWTSILTVAVGVILASAFSAILVYAQELVRGKVGMIAGLFFGPAFGMAGIGSAALGKLADRTSITYVFHVCSYLPLIGLMTGFLPNLQKRVR